jgi:hypothetical protein
MHKETIAKFCEYLIAQGLVDILPEVNKLAQLIITFPETISSDEKSFSSLNGIRIYLRNTQV